MDVAIRQGTIQDAQGVIDVINSVIQEGGLTALYPALTVEQQESFIEDLGPRSAMFVAEIAGTIFGVQTVEPFASYTRAMDHVAVMGTYVYRNYRRQGVGRLLAEHTLGYAREQGYEKAVAYVRAGNSAGQAFYREIGFVPKMVLERQIKIGDQYDDQVWMELFIPAPLAESAAERELVIEPVADAASVLRPTPEARGEPAPAQPVVVEKPTIAVDPVVGAVTVRRAKRQDLRVLTAIMRGTMHWRQPPTEDQVLDMLYDKGYWLAISRKGGGLTGWRAENLVMCIDDFYVYPPQYHPQVGGPLLETVEAEAIALSCEVAIAFLEEQIAPQAVEFFAAQGYRRQSLDALYNVWREVAEEFLTGSRFMMVKRLRETRIMRPL
jgi:GNAT superfamily N-acetyltransferase